MPRVKHTQPKPQRQKGQRSVDPIDVTLYRILPAWQQPEWYRAEIWRKFVAAQPVATLSRNTLIEQFLSFDWKIEPRDSTKRDELKPQIKYYEKFFNYTGDYDYSEIVQWIGADMLDIPFGGAAEVGRQGDSSNGKVMWLKPLDGSTLFPTYSRDFPVGQAIQELPLEPVFFPKHAINRIYFAPRRELRREGWGMAPPEMIYLAAELLNRGDSFYASLLVDTPPPGILDLGDMAKTAAEEWVKGFRMLLGGTEAYKIPVLYEHNNQVNWLNFNRPPTELMYDKVTMKYAAFVAAGYGISLSDIGLQAVSSGGETLAGSIRQERRTKRTGLAIFKKKMKYFFDRLLPPTLQFRVIDLDDEVSVAVSRARLAQFTGATQAIQAGMFTAQEMRQQTIADGLVDITVSETIPEGSMPPPQQNPPERPSLLGRPVSPSGGGQGEVRSDYFEDEMDRIANIESARLRRLIRSAIEPVAIETRNAYFELPFEEMGWWNQWHDDILWGDMTEKIPEFTLTAIADAEKRIAKAMQGDKWWELRIDNTMLNDFRGLFQEVEKQKLREKAELAYEKGETDKLITEFEIDKEQEDKFIESLSGEIEAIKSEWTEDIKKHIISGIRNALSSGEVARFFDDNLDTDKILRDNAIVDYVRAQLYNARYALMEKLADRISEKIKGI